jgi:hypothetical protein
MADVKISELTANASPAAADVAAVSNAAATATNKVTLQAIARLFSDPSGVTGADAITNVMSLSQSEYDAIGAGNYDAATLYVIT